MRKWGSGVPWRSRNTRETIMQMCLKLIVYFLLWTLYSYSVHVFAHSRSRFNFLKYFHNRHHAYNYGDSKVPPWHDYFFWFGDWRSSIDVYITFTLPLIVLTIFEPVCGGILLAFHYLYEVFLSKNVLDHNENIDGPVTKVVPIGTFHLAHHKYVKCNYSFFITLWDHVFGTTQDRLADRIVLKQRRQS
jgi:sterol desaturase/sphingolipid hydroxylase (fatty acid hydroxylase superfamily)